MAHKKLFGFRMAILLLCSWTTEAIIPVLSADSSPPSLTNRPADMTLRDLPLSASPSPSSGTEVASNAGPDVAAAIPPIVAAAAVQPAVPSQNVTINLINLMVKRGLITPADSAALIKQAEEEADLARAQAANTQATAERALVAQAPAPAPAPTPATPVDDEVRVTYVPDVVKNQIRDEVTETVEKNVRDEHLASTDNIPDWVKRFHIVADIRVRYEGQSFPTGNDNTGSFVNFNAINTGSGFDINPHNPLILPYYDVDQNRDRFRLRARMGANMDLGDGFSFGLRIATGSDDNPVTENQTLGAANGQGGYFGKYQIWLDRAFLKYEIGGHPDKDLSFTIGRFDNPFMHTSMIWADDLAFDGMIAQAKYQVAPGLVPFMTAGGFPVFNTDFNFSTDQSAKFQSEDKYLFAVQTGANWTINPDFSAKGALALYYFENIEGKVSSPIPDQANEVGNTDDSRPTFEQNGNTVVPIRNFSPVENPADTTVRNQYYGLATPFHDVALTGQIDFNRLDPFHIWLIGEAVKNLAFDRASIETNGPAYAPGPVNNLDGSSFVGGDAGYMTKLYVGKVSLEHFGDWNANVSYRYVESDATVDAFTDADFGGDLTGTNLKGYTIGGNLALSSRVWATLTWMSADAIAGPTYKNDLIQADINAKF